jgi:hypothetical protein
MIAPNQGSQVSGHVHIKSPTNGRLVEQNANNSEIDGGVRYILIGLVASGGVTAHAAQPRSRTPDSLGAPSCGLSHPAANAR